ncbi:MAG: lysine--tRNA ligase [Candidatus Blackburnbacteria bacterium]|nr:lysine--tRNA ligase [Candidatus Blackburnbacteria bacterium]
MAKRLDNLREVRLAKLQKAQARGINPYPASYNKTHTVLDAREVLGEIVSVAGRVWGWREHGAFVFADIRDETGQMQLWFQKGVLGEDFETLELFDIGDFIGVKGEVVKTQAGEVTINVSTFALLAKGLRPLPSSWYGLKDVEERYRKRYLDLLLNPEVRERFNVRTKLVRETRRYLDNLGYWEVETPVLQPLYGGANAKPFKTHVNVLDEDFYLRIAPELYLKRLIVGGYEKVYEIAKDFRNEGMDLTHNPEFTMIEYYEAYVDYRRMMQVTEGLFKQLAKVIFDDTKMQVGEHMVDIGKEWRKITMVELMKEQLGIDVESATEEELVEYCRKEEIALLGGETRGQLIFVIFEHKIPGSLIEPTWVLDYPKDVSPLAKDHPVKEGWVERFEGYIGGKEICDGWSELTNPIEQRARFERDVKAARKDREEAQYTDEDFLEAMEYGMPPLGGIGIGIDRLSMFYTNTWSVKELILFPTMRKR